MASSFTDPTELPSLQQIEQMEKQQSQAIQALEISDSGDSVKCQRCGNTVPIIVGSKSINKSTKGTRIDNLEKRIKWLSGYRHYYHTDVAVIKQLKGELAELLAEEAKADKFRNLPLYSCKITDFKFVCSKCYDKIYTTYAAAK
jgi:hypothetical protein